MYIIENSKNVFDMHLRKMYREHINKNVMIFTYSNKYYFGVLIDYYISTYSNKISNTFFVLKKNNTKISISGIDVKNIYAESKKNIDEYKVFNKAEYLNDNILKNIKKYVGHLYFYYDIS